MIPVLVPVLCLKVLGALIQVLSARSISRVAIAGDQQVLNLQILYPDIVHFLTERGRRELVKDSAPDFVQPLQSSKFNQDDEAKVCEQWLLNQNSWSYTWRNLRSEARRAQLLDSVPLMPKARHPGMAKVLLNHSNLLVMASNLPYSSLA